VTATNAGIDGVVLAHGLSSREDLPIPFTYALVGAAVALLVSFLALGLLWRDPRLKPATSGVAFPARLQSLLDGRPTRVLLRLLGLAATAYIVLGAVAGKDDALNPTAGVVYVLFWVGLPLLSALLGPVWRLVNPVRTVHELLARLMGTRADEGMGRLPTGVGYWPAAAMLLAFVWLELVAPDNDTLPVLRTFFAGYFAVNLLAATYFGSRWFDKADGFEAYSTLIGRISPLGRRGDGHLVLRNPLAGLAGTPVAPGLFAVVGVLLGSTAFDSLANSPRWINLVQDSALPPRWTQTLGLATVVGVVTGAFFLAASLSGRGSGHRPRQLGGEFAHTLIPIVLGYVVAHYWSLLVLVGQTTLIRLSDPLGTGADWLGTADRGVDGRLADPGFVAVLQVTAVVTGHVLGVVLAHDRAVRLFPRNRAVAGQIPLLVLMVCYTVGGLSLLFGS
jgi:hypothetical protein